MSNTHKHSSPFGNALQCNRLVLWGIVLLISSHVPARDLERSDTIAGFDTHTIWEDIAFTGSPAGVYLPGINQTLSLPHQSERETSLIDSEAQTTCRLSTTLCPISKNEVAFLDIDGSTFVVYAFRAPGFNEFMPPPGVNSVEVLVVGGGGGGGGFERAGGGGAGGILSGNLSVTPGTTIAIHVGSGGQGGAPNEQGANGQSSMFGDLVALGGGGGGSGDASLCLNSLTGEDGGSGGGASWYVTDCQETTNGGQGLQQESNDLQGFGNDGGTVDDNNNGPHGAGAGGGGAGAAGADGEPGQGGAGGEGKDFSKTFGNRFGASGWFGGGGGGGAATEGIPGAGGQGGGGTGAMSGSTGQPGVDYTGGGGGGGSLNDSATGENRGGHGIVLIRYAYEETTKDVELSGAWGTLFVEEDIHVAVSIPKEKTFSINIKLELEKNTSLSLQGQSSLILVDDVDIIVDENAQLIIGSHASLLIGPDAGVETLGQDDNQGRIVLESDATYLNLGQGSPLLEVLRDLKGSGPGWRMVTSPVASSYADLLEEPLVTQGFDGASHTQNDQPNLLWWDETNIGTTLQGWRAPDHINDNILPARGHFHFVFNGTGIINADGSHFDDQYPDALPLTMSATGKEPNIYERAFAWNKINGETPVTAPLTWTKRPENQDDQIASGTETTFTDINLADEGWNLIGNPTASTLDWNAGNEAWSKTHLDASIYLWDPAANNGHGAYLVSNGQNGDFNGLIAPFQAFWVRANNENPALSFTNSAKTGKATTDFCDKNAACTQDIHIPLKLESNGQQTTAYISLTNEGVTGPDAWDAYRLEPMTQTWLALYMNSSLRHVMPLVINNLPRYSEHGQHIPLFVNAQRKGAPEGGRFILSWELPSDWPYHKTITLMDHVNKKATSMTRYNSYSIDLTFTKSNVASACNPLKVPTRLADPSRLPGNTEYDSGSDGDTKSTGYTTNQWQQFSIVIGDGSSREEPEYLARNPMLMPPYPNPAKEMVHIGFRLIDHTKVRIDLYDIHGRHVATPFAGNYPPGLTELPWQPSGLNTGLYIVKMNTPQHAETQRLTIINQ